ncbi:hypothetical protein ACOSQ3_028745 [Xanthoceras sorbifolium]
MAGTRQDQRPYVSFLPTVVTQVKGQSRKVVQMAREGISQGLLRQAQIGISFLRRVRIANGVGDVVAGLWNQSGHRTAVCRKGKDVQNHFSESPLVGHGISLQRSSQMKGTMIECITPSGLKQSSNRRASKILLLPQLGKGEENYPRVLPGDFPCPLFLR